MQISIPFSARYGSVWQQPVFIISLIATFVYGLFVCGISEMLAYADVPIPRIFQILGGRLPGGLIQITTVFLFIYGLLTLLSHRRKLAYERQAFDLNLLPVGEQKVLRPDSVNEIKLQMLELERAGYKHQLIGLIKRVCTQYRNESSISQAHMSLDAQLESIHAQEESQFGILNYILPAISSVGFIGTVLGLSEAIGNFNSDLATITGKLYIAFDTTFLALLLAIPLSYYFNKVQEEYKSLNAESRRFILDNLVSRIYHGGSAK
jgi:biopolymer transport protein ExbB/TolQ